MTDLKLLALDLEDLEVISAHTQDAVVRVGDMGYARSDRRFAFLMNRYAWEAGAAGGRKGQRRRAAIHFDNVDTVQIAGFDVNAVDGVLDLLSIAFDQTEAPSGFVVIAFAGGGTVRLGVECLEARLQDLGSAWSARGRPVHDLPEMT
ncbi:MAG TPA: DUF2948 family protein [Devosiaceae bacterium]|nr:DUF2948 family protein [Devosiaceae bacterium]